MEYFGIIVILFCVSIMPLLILVEFMAYLKGDGDFLKPKVRLKVEFILIIIIPWIYLLVTETRAEIDCCDESILFAPDYRMSVFIWIVIVQLCYLFATYRQGKSSPIIEVLVNCGLLIGIVLNVAICIQMDYLLWILGSLPIILILVMKLMDIQKVILDDIGNEEFEGFNFIMYASTQVLGLRLFLRYPLLLLVCLPLITLITGVFTLFGQRPDAVILTFTETYGMGFSQLDHLCQNVNCGGHYLCSVAANGHKTIVKPTRYGMRAGSRIICNRQLLVCNTFENIVERHWPFAHKFIRRNFDKVGDHVHSNYEIYEVKLVSDVIYYLMKPLEYLFVAVLYFIETDPESSIALQYLSKDDKNYLQRRIR